jgi:hypothetical protein
MTYNNIDNILPDLNKSYFRYIREKKVKKKSRSRSVKSKSNKKRVTKWNFNFMEKK